MPNRSGRGPGGVLLAVAGLLAILFAATPARAQGVYKVVGPDGRITYSDSKPAGADGTATTIDVTPSTGSGGMSRSSASGGGAMMRLPDAPTQGRTTTTIRTVTRQPPRRALASSSTAPPPPAISPAPGAPGRGGRVTGLEAVAPEAIRSALAGAGYVAFLDPGTDQGWKSGECLEYQHFAVFRHGALKEGADPGKPTSTFSNELTLSVCRDGPMGPVKFRQVLQSSEAFARDLERAQPGIGAQLAGRVVNIGGHEASIAPLLVMGHGLTITPVGVLDGRIGGATIIASIDEATAHIGEPGHLTMADALQQLEMVLRTVDSALPRESQER